MSPTLMRFSLPTASRMSNGAWSARNSSRNVVQHQDAIRRYDNNKTNTRILCGGALPDVRSTTLWRNDIRDELRCKKAQERNKRSTRKMKKVLNSKRICEEYKARRNQKGTRQNTIRDNSHTLSCTQYCSWALQVLHSILHCCIAPFCCLQADYSRNLGGRCARLQVAPQ